SVATQRLASVATQSLASVATQSLASVATQSLDGIELAGTPGRQHPEQQPHADRDAEGERDRPPRDHRRERADRFGEHGQPDPEPEPDHATEAGQDDGLEQELPGDVPRPGAEGLAQ